MRQCVCNRHPIIRTGAGSGTYAARVQLNMQAIGWRSATFALRCQHNAACRGLPRCVVDSLGPKILVSLLITLVAGSAPDDFLG